MKKTLLRVMAGCCLITFLSGTESALLAQTIAKAEIKTSRASQINLKDIHPLTVGDALPDILFDKIYNYSTNRTNTAAFSDRLLILDFMTTSCKSCIEALPKLDAIQKQFGTNVQTFLVTYEKQERVKSFLEKNKIGKQIKLAFAAEDSILKAYFPHEFISHVVWIYKGKIKAITGTQYVKTENVEILLKGNDVNWPVKRDAPEYDFTRSVLVPNESNFQSYNLPSKIYYSSITSYIDGVADNYKTQIDSANQVVSVRMINSPITDLYLRSYGIFRFPLSRMMLEVKNNDRFIYNSSVAYRAAWEQENCYCYEGAFPSNLSKSEIGEKIRNDLNFYFNVRGRLERRLVNSYVMMFNGTAGNSKIKSSKSHFMSDEDSDSIMISVPNIVYHVNEILYNKPVIDGTDLGQESHLLLSRKALSDFELLKIELKNYGIILREEARQVEMFVLTEPEK